ncbi:tyrosine-protein kinase Fer isoform X1 [Hydra vulgaris]|uniref:tyrosine-protein kinase Fer isoform X1 n=1 Tax=Hydra vulgaris TaxID=6087 RepID=UPI001F5F8B55|nr:tyrosine-protein kinase Fer [Hydra vulgaris]
MPYIQNNSFCSEINSEKESFSFYLEGKNGIDYVEKMSKEEIKLLEQMEDYVSKRYKLDLEYATKLGKLHEKFTFDNNVNGNLKGSLIEKAWRMYITEAENKAISISNLVKQLNMQTLPQIKLLLMSKKDMYDKFSEVKSSMDSKFDGSAEEVNRFWNIYKDSLKKASNSREKLSKIDSKNSKDWQKEKKNFDQHSQKLHMTHNEYCLSIAAVNEHQKEYHKNLVPFLLNFMQDIHEEYVQPWKEILLSLQSSTSWCRQEFITSENEIQQSIAIIKPTDEYKGFLNSYNKLPVSNTSYLFDDHLVSDESVTSGLTKDTLAVNDLTHQQLISKKNKIEDDVSKMEESVDIKKKNSQEEETALKNMQADKNNNLRIRINQHFRYHNVNFEIEEVKCKLNIHQVQLKVITEAIQLIGENGPPCYSTLLPPIPSNNENDNNEKKRRTTLPNFLQFRSKNEINDANNVENNNRISNDLSDSSESQISYEQPIESLNLSPWFHGKIDRATISRLLKHDGDFIVREKSDNSGTNVLSVLWKGSIKHFILKANDKGLYTLEGESFSSINALITHHYERRSVIQSSTGIILMNSVNRIFMDGDDYIVPQDDVQLKCKLGGGHFGDVYKGVLLSKQIMLAVKTCKENVSDVIKKQFLEEAEIMKTCMHKNVLKLIGVCRDKEPYYILLELCDKGDLLALLKKEGPNFTQMRLFDMSMDIARGMAYLEQKQIIHRDLAARNCLVTNDYDVKISDFGMSREEDDEGTYTIQTTKEIPFKWCAPEVWLDTKYSTKTDVWSYGVTLYEIYSLGQQPYPGWTNKQAREEINAGYRMPSPAKTPPEVYELMRKCWHFSDFERPSFSEIINIFENIRLHIFKMNFLK